MTYSKEHIYKNTYCLDSGRSSFICITLYKERLVYFVLQVMSRGTWDDAIATPHANK